MTPGVFLQKVEEKEGKGKDQQTDTESVKASALGSLIGRDKSFTALLLADN